VTVDWPSTARRWGGTLACAVFFALGANASAVAEDYPAFRDAMAEFSANLRGAVFYLRTKNTMMAAFDLDAAESHWTPFIKRYAAKPPDVYGADPGWQATFGEVSANLAVARTAAAKGDVDTARRAVGTMRKALADLRRRNGIFVFEDCVDEMRQAFGRLYVYRRNPPDFNLAEQVAQLKAAAAVAEYVYRRCYETAPPAYRRDDMFERLFADSFKDYRELPSVIARGARREFIDLLRQIISNEHLIFLRFG